MYTSLLYSLLCTSTKFHKQLSLLCPCLYTCTYMYMYICMPRSHCVSVQRRWDLTAQFGAVTLWQPASTSPDWRVWTERVHYWGQHNKLHVWLCKVHSRSLTTARWRWIDFKMHVYMYMYTYVPVIHVHVHGIIIHLLPERFLNSPNIKSRVVLVKRSKNCQILCHIWGKYYN